MTLIDVSNTDPVYWQTLAWSDVILNSKFELDLAH